jgi:ATP-dependent helicase HrpA
VTAKDFSWPVPGLRQDLVVALLRSLPKSLRRNFVPAPDVAAAFLAAAHPGEEPVLDALERHLRRTTGVVVQRSDWRLDAVPAHLRPRYTVVSDTGNVVAASRDLDALRLDLASIAEAAVAATGEELERSGITRWDFDAVPRELAATRAGAVVHGYPALIDEGGSVALRVLTSPEAQQQAMRVGVRRLLMLTVALPPQRITEGLDTKGRLELGLCPGASPAQLLEDCYACAVDHIVEECGGPAWERSHFARLVQSVESEGLRQTEEVVTAARAALVAAAEVNRRLTGRVPLQQLPSYTDLQSQWSRLVYAGFVADAGLPALRHYPRYFTAMQQRLDRLADDPRRDGRLMATMAQVQAAYLHASEAQGHGTPQRQQLQDIRWMLEELRLSLFAPTMRSARPISVERVQTALNRLG